MDGPRNIKPGQPITLRWGITSDFNVLGNLIFNCDMGTATAVIRYNGRDIVMVRRHLHMNYGFSIGPKGRPAPFDNSTPPPPPIVVDRTLPDEFYRIGTQTLEIEVTGDGPERGPLTAELYVNVQPETIDQTWWRWTHPPQPTDLQWNRGYGVGGQFTSTSRFSSMTNLSFNLHERTLGSALNPTSSGSLINRGSISVGAVPIGGNSTLSFPEIRQNWSWITPVVWVITDYSTGRSFNYDLSGSFQDQYGNQYQLSSTLETYVRISVEKVVAGVAAMNGMFLSAALLVSAGIAALIPVVGWATAGPLLAASGVALTAAQGLGAIALDPPEPDLNYEEKVKVPHLDISKALKKYSEFPKLGTMLELVATLIRFDEALSRIERKRMGATLDGNKRAVKRQTLDYENMQKHMIELTKTLSQTKSSIKAEFRSKKFLTKDNIRKQFYSWQQNGIPDEIRKAALKAGITGENLSSILKCMESHANILEQITEISSGNLDKFMDPILKWSSIVSSKMPAPNKI